MLLLGILQASLRLDRVDDSVDCVLGHLQRNSLRLLAPSSFGPSVCVRLILCVELGSWDRVAVAQLRCLTGALLVQRGSRLAIVLVLGLGSQVISSSAALLVEWGECALLIRSQEILTTMFQ